MSDLQDDDFGDVMKPKKAGGGSFKDLFHDKFPAGKSHWQIAPGTKSLKGTDKFSQYYAHHWGYTRLVEGRNTPVPRTFLCIQKVDFKTKAVIQECPECTSLAALQLTIEEETVKLKKQGKSKDQIKAELAELTKEIQSFGGRKREQKYYVIARPEGGEWRILRLGSSIHKQIRAMVDKTPGLLNPQGAAWFTINKTGSDFSDVKYTVELRTTLENGQEVLKKTAFTENDREAIRALPDLTQMEKGGRLSYEQIKAMVESNRDPEIVTAIFNQSQLERSPESSPAQSLSAPAPQPKVTSATSSAKQSSVLEDAGIDPEILAIINAQ